MLNILIIDDSQIIRNLLDEYLSELGHNCDFAVDGQKGIDKAIANDYHLIFCDVHMPRKNGYKVFKEVTAVKKEQIFIMTDSLPDSLAEQAHKEGAWSVLTKPFDLNELNEVISEITKKVFA